MFPSEITIGVFTFEYDAESKEMFIAKGEEQIAGPAYVSHEDWLSFYAICCIPEVQLKTAELAKEKE